MSTRTEREKNKKQYDRHTSILMELLREDQNKYCADCRAKGPRWASWNLGIFVCITCAGIHRNLGVHISKVKSVNLDAWTAEQVKNVQEWGNKRAAEYYEFHLPDGFRRPHGDSSLEQFIRNKYEKKLYINKSGPPPARPTINSPEKVSQEKKKSSDNENKKISRPEPSKAVQNVAKTNNAPSNKAPSATADLLSLSEPVAPPSQSQPPPPEQNSTLLSISATTTKQDNTADLLNFGGSSFQAPANNVQQPASQGFAFDLAQSMSTPAPVANTAPTSNGVMTSSNQTNLEENLFKDDLSSGGQSKKDSIMALYQPSQKQANPQMFGVPGGVYLQQQQQQQQQQQMNVMAMNRPQGMTPQYNTQQQMFGAPQQQQQMHQVNQVQQQMAMLGFGQQQQQPSTQAMPNNRATPNVQAGAGYNYNQPMPGMMQHNNGPAPYGNTPVVNGSWMPRPPGNFPQQQPTPQYVTTGPAAPRFNTYQAQGGVQSGHTLSTNLWK